MDFQRKSLTGPRIRAIPVMLVSYHKTYQKKVYNPVITFVKNRCNFFAPCLAVNRGSGCKGKTAPLCNSLLHCAGSRWSPNGCASAPVCLVASRKKIPETQNVFLGLYIVHMHYSFTGARYLFPRRLPQYHPARRRTGPRPRVPCAERTYIFLTGRCRRRSYTEALRPTAISGRAG